VNVDGELTVTVASRHSVATLELYGRVVMSNIWEVTYKYVVHMMSLGKDKTGLHGDGPVLVLS